MQKKDTRPAGEDGLEGARAAEEIEKLRLITDSMPVLIAYVDAGHCYRFNNRVYEEWFGQKPSDLDGRHVKEILGEGAYAALLPYIEKVFSGERVVFDGKVPYREGGERYIRATYSPHWADGKVKGYFSLVQDITAQQRTEKAWHKSEELLKIALEAGRMGVFEFDIRSGKVAWSPNLEKIHGLAPGTFGGTFEDFKRDIHPDDLNRVLNRVQQTIQEKKTDYGVEYRIIKPNGETAWVEARGRVFYDPNGGAERFVGLCMDVTARKGAEETLQNEFAFRRAIEDAIPAGITMVDPNGRKTYVNRAFCDMVGWSESELVGADPPYLYWPPEEIDRISQAFEATMAGKVPPGGFELRFRRRNETRFDVVLTPVPVRDNHGALTGWLASVVDITGRKGIEQKLQESETQYRLLFETNPQPMWVYEIESMAFLEVNEAAVRHYGYSREEFLSMTVKEIRPPEDIPKLAQKHADVPKEVALGLRSAGVWRHRKKDGTIIEVEITRSPIVFKGRKALLILASDVTERRRAEEERVGLLAREQQARREAEAANRAKDEFLATVSHELRTPLNAIYGWARLLQMGDLDRETVTSAYETIERNAKAQAQLIDDLLDVSRIIAGKLRLDVRSIALKPVIEAAIETVQTAANAKGITLDSTFDERIESISGDPDRLQQVVWNLLSNAIKFTPTGGRVEIELRRIDSAIQIRVEDAGIGIHPEFLPYVFDRFRQAERVSTRFYGGLGLGLAIVRHLVELHGGTVSAESPGEGKGANFTVTLPLKVLSEESPDPEMKRSEETMPPTPAMMLEGVEVLLVDDEADARELLTLILQRSGARVITVSSTREAIDRLKRKKPDLLVSDIEMPGEDGYSLIRKVRAREAERGERSVPAVALTAYAGRADRRRALMAGFQKHVPKPVDPAGLVAVVAGLIGLPREEHRAPDRSSDEANSR
ncbi:PAS domain-containing hybrid sensor histidine kinase/response regulator [Candidatus Manganitrophus noduliformans]|nr:PAS domain S-box protein [Candidatus Manganitrophus noduliformans]